MAHRLALVVDDSKTARVTLRRMLEQHNLDVDTLESAPEALDYLPDEEEGGNIILPRVDGPISVKASFETGNDRQGAPITIEYDRLYCAENEE